MNRDDPTHDRERPGRTAHKSAPREAGRRDSSAYGADGADSSRTGKAAGGPHPRDGQPGSAGTAPQTGLAQQHAEFLWENLPEYWRAQAMEKGMWVDVVAHSFRAIQEDERNVWRATMRLIRGRLPDDAETYDEVADQLRAIQASAYRRRT